VADAVLFNWRRLDRLAPYRPDAFSIALVVRKCNQGAAVTSQAHDALHLIWSASRAGAFKTLV
jgi:hypothetical protein